MFIRMTPIVKDTTVKISNFYELNIETLHYVIYFIEYFSEQPIKNNSTNLQKKIVQLLNNVFFMIFSVDQLLAINVCLM